MKIPEKILLGDWKFALGNTKECLLQGRTIQVPHTWNREEGTENYFGTGWYEYTFEAPHSWKNKRIRVCFKAVYHHAQIYLNGEEVAQHTQSGYTPFSVDITLALKLGEANTLVVKVNNEFTEDLLPYDKSYDWAADGGIIRDVQLSITGEQYVQHCVITAKPIITDLGIRQDRGYGALSADISLADALEVDGGGSTPGSSVRIMWKLYEGCDSSLVEVANGEAQPIKLSDPEQIFEEKNPKSKTQYNISMQLLPSISYWHFDNPCLYTLEVQVLRGSKEEEEKVLDVVTTTLGFRDFYTEGNRFVLNGEYVRLCGTEWMPGSNPNFGNAETKEQLEHMLIRLKESNSVFTRFHWQQDDFIYDWCDRHGMLVQEEIPYWGPKPKKAGAKQLDIAKKQLVEMIDAHRNHPSIIAWGVGNELTAQRKETIQYIRGAIAYARKLDPSRLITYVSNTIFQNPSTDGGRASDMIFFNEYIGTWNRFRNLHKELKRLVEMYPDNPLVPSEFGLCEPQFKGGDVRRSEIFMEKIEAYRLYEFAGIINFSLNDYRTHMGEEGEGRFKQRVHGSTDLYGNIKPSYSVVQREMSPCVVVREGTNLVISCRASIPCYRIKGYYFTVNHEERDPIVIPDLLPGEHWESPVPSDTPITIHRPNGDVVGCFY